MRGSRSILALMALLVAGSASIAFSQDQDDGSRELRRNRNMDRMRAIRQSTHFSGIADQGRSRLGTFQESRFSGMRTRSEQLDSLLKSFRPERTERDLTQLDNPIRDILEGRNLLSPRSSLAKKAVASQGRNLIVPTGKALSPEAASSLKPTTAADLALDTILNSHAHDSDEYFQKGLKCFRKGDFIRAEDYFDIDADVNYKLARPYAAGVVAAYHGADYHKAYFLLLTAFNRANTLDDLRLDVNAFYPDRQDFQRKMNEINIWAKSYPDRAGPNAILAYYSWLNGDRATSLAAIEVSIQHPGNSEEGAACQKFHDLMAAAPATTQPSP